MARIGSGSARYRWNRLRRGWYIMSYRVPTRVPNGIEPQDLDVLIRDIGKESVGFMMGRPLSPIVVIGLLAVLIAACDDTTPPVFYPDAEPPEAGPDADTEDGDVSDLGCRYDTQCEDSMDCTDDRCDTATGLCEHTPNHEACHDESLCNGFEYCDALLGCQPGIPYPGCNDHDACTVDICEEPEEGRFEPTCDHLAMDRDGDGHVDYHCAADPIDDPEGPRGDDCDDLDPHRFPGAGEFCFDGEDNDCDMLIDDLDEDCLLSNDSCAGAIELVPDRRREGFTLDAIADVDTSCGWSGGADVVYYFVVTEESDVTVEVWGRDSFYPTVSVQVVCNDRTSEVRCLSGSTTTRFFERAMAPGTYYVVIESWSPGIFDILLTIEDPEPPPEGDTCESPILLEDGDMSSVTLADFSGAVPVSCASSTSYIDVVYAFALSEEQNVRYEVSGAGFTPYVAVSTVCGDFGTELICDGGNPQARELCAVPAGTYYLVARGNRVGDLDVSLEFSDPGEPAVNDVCDTAIDISEGGTFSGSLLCSEGDYDLSCEFWDNYDVVYSFTIDEAQDVQLRLSAEDSLNPSLAVLTTCGDRTAELFCQRAATPSTLIRSMSPGTYYVQIAGEYQADFELELTFGAPTTACGDAEVVTESATFSGDTSRESNDFGTTCGGRGQGPDVPYQIVMETPFDMVAEVTSAAYDTVLHLRRECDDAATEIRCDDDGGEGVLSRLETPGLEAGTYYLIFDGYHAGALGPYTLDIDITPVVEE